jgi:hypothetical protein
MELPFVKPFDNNIFLHISGSHHFSFFQYGTYDLLWINFYIGEKCSEKVNVTI